MIAEVRAVTNRGYTGHAMLDGVKLIHMNGRVYDPELGRFLSPDPNIPEPGNSQAYNRYSYVYNNPLRYTDPSGFVAYQEWSPVQTRGWQFWSTSSMEGYLLGSGQIALNGGLLLDRGMDINHDSPHVRNAMIKEAVARTLNEMSVDVGTMSAQLAGGTPDTLVQKTEISVATTRQLNPAEKVHHDALNDELERYFSVVVASGNESWLSNFFSTNVVFDPDFVSTDTDSVAYACHACDKNGMNRITVGPRAVETLNAVPTTPWQIGLNNPNLIMYHGFAVWRGPDALFDILAHEFGHTFAGQSRVQSTNNSTFIEVHANIHMEHIRRLRDQRGL